MQRTEQQIRSDIAKRIEELSYIVNGLDNNDSFKRLISVWQRTKDAVDSAWHLTGDMVKLSELRITKYASLELINILPNMKNELEKLQEELVKMENPDEIINKDYDPN